MRKLAVTSVLLTALLISGCSRTKDIQPTDVQTTIETTETQISTETETTTENQVPAEPTTETVVQPEEPTDSVGRSAREIYREALDNLHDHNMLPGGDEADTSLGDIETNQFAIFDVDGDGREELIIRISLSASVAGMVELVYGINEQGELFAELTAFPSLTYYTDGHVTTDISHNQGYAGEFWPYTLLQYDKDTDAWEQVAFVDAMDKSLMEEMGAADLYPEDADTSGSGFVYYIGSDEPVDVTEYQAWYDAWHSKTEPIDVPYRALTMENIELVTD